MHAFSKSLPYPGALERFLSRGVPIYKKKILKLFSLYKSLILGGRPPWFPGPCLPICIKSFWYIRLKNVIDTFIGQFDFLLLNLCDKWLDYDHQMKLFWFAEEFSCLKKCCMEFHVMTSNNKLLSLHLKMFFRVNVNLLWGQWGQYVT